MKEGLTSINVVVDQSGSMSKLTNDTIGGYNTFLAEQKALSGEALFTLCLFSDTHRLVHDCEPLSAVPALTTKTYRPGGGTALLDAIGSTMTEVGAKLASMKEEDRPEKVLFLIITDGEENSSKEYTKEQIKEMVSHQTEKYNWVITYIGANLDAVKEGTSLGISASNSVNYSSSSVGTRRLYQDISRSTSRARYTKGVISPQDQFLDSKDLRDEANPPDAKVAQQPAVVQQPKMVKQFVDKLDAKVVNQPAVLQPVDKASKDVYDPDADLTDLSDLVDGSFLKNRHMPQTPPHNRNGRY